MRRFFSVWADSEEAPNDETGFDPEGLVSNANKCTMLSDACEPDAIPCACELVNRCSQYSEINATTWTDVNACLRPSAIHRKRGDEPDSTSSDAIVEDESAKEFRHKFECGLLFATCESGERPCACNLVQRCDGSMATSVSNRELNACLAGDGPHPGVGAAELADDGPLRCSVAIQLCLISENADSCGCEAQQRCFDHASSRPDWSELESCYNDMNTEVKGTDLPKRDRNDDSSSSELCSHTTDSCHQGSECACYFSQCCGAKGGLPGCSFGTMKTCLAADRRKSPRNEGGSPTYSEFSLHPGDKLTTHVMGTTIAMSVSQTSPMVIVETGGYGEDHFTMVNSIVQEDPLVVAATGVMDGVKVAFTVVPHKRDLQASEDDEQSCTSSVATMTLPDGTLTTQGVYADVSHKAMIATYGDESQSGTIIMSPVKTTSASVSVSMAWIDQSYPATTMAAESVDMFTDPVQMASSLVEEFRTKDQHGAGPASPASSIFDEKLHPVRDESESTASTSTTTVAIVGNMSTPYSQVIDAQGKPIYVTRTGHFAASTTTLTFSGSVEPASTTRTGVSARYTTGGGQLVEYRIVTETRTVHDAPVCTPYSRIALADKTVMHLGNDKIALSTGLQMIDNRTMHLKLANWQPRTTLAPLPENWGYVDYGSASYPPVTHLNEEKASNYFSIPKIFEMNDEIHTMTNASMSIHGTAVIMDPLARFMEYDARTHRVAPTPACELNSGFRRVIHGWGKRECEIEKCMWDNMRPMHIHTVFPAAFADNNCQQRSDYFTQRTYLEEPHWGTTHEAATYYPAIITLAAKSGTMTKTRDGTEHIHLYPTCVAKNMYPVNYDERHHLDDVQDLPCFDVQSCHQHCVAHHAGFPAEVVLLLIVLPILFGLPLVLFLFCCLPAWFLHHRRRQRTMQDPSYDEKQRRSSAMDKLRRKSNAPPGAVINAVTGQAIDPATGRAVEGGPGTATAIVAGTAAGAAAAAAGTGAAPGSGAEGKEGSGGQSVSDVGSGGSGSGGDHSAAGAAGAAEAAAAHPITKVSSRGGSSDEAKGTLGRQAEEGRSRVHFDDALKAVPEGEPHVVSVPPKTDGTMESASGRESWADVGSMRGRKRNRPEGQQMNLG